METIAFVACIERGVLERQALLLFESIRRYSGRFRNASIFALSPRAGHSIASHTQRRLDDLQVTFIDKILNTECTEYGSANRVAAAAHVEEFYPHETLVILDSDTLFLREPDLIELTDDVDVAVRPVDVKGMCTDGPTDPFDRYWRDLCDLCGVDYDDVLWTESFVDRHRIKASYNGGLVVARGNLGVMQRWSNFFFASVRRGLRPYEREWRLRSGASWVDSTASRFWGSNQAALSLAIWSTTRRVMELPPSYNYPLHQHERIEPRVIEQYFRELVHVHYHWLLEEPPAKNPLFVSDGPLSEEQRRWLLSFQPVPGFL